MPKHDSNKISARRKLLKGLVAGGGAIVAGKSLPESWSRPVVDAMMLPAHAQTSNVISFTSSTVLTAIPTDNQVVRLLGGVINKAHAQDYSDVDHFVDKVCIKANAGGTEVSVDALIGHRAGDIILVTAASVPVGGMAAPTTMTTTVECPTSHNINIVGSPQSDSPVALIEKLGLIQDARAGGAHKSPITVRVDSIDGVAVGLFYVDNNTIAFSLSPGDCSAPLCPLPT